MNFPPFRFFHRWLTVTAILAIVFTALGQVVAEGAVAPTLLDDFSKAKRHGTERLLFNDKELGSQSHATQTCEDGVLVVRGELVPGRGVPAFISLPLLLSADAQPHDLSQFEGVRLRIKVARGTITLQVASAEIQNFDFHTSAPLAAKRGEFQEIRVAFKDLKRGWSETIPLNLKTITSVNLVAFGTSKDAFAYEVDEIGFY